MKEIDCEECAGVGRYLSHAGGKTVDGGECNECHGKGVIDPAESALVPVEFKIIDDGMYMFTSLASVEHEGAKIDFLLTLNGACIIVKIKKDGKTTDYQLTPDALGNAVYREWKKTNE